jgi:hypothetical protein
VKWDSVKWVVGEIFVGEKYPNHQNLTFFNKKKKKLLNYFNENILLANTILRKRENVLWQNAIEIQSFLAFAIFVFE